MPHPAYSRDMASSDYHLFRSMEYFLWYKSFKENRDLQNQLDAYFEAKPSLFTGMEFVSWSQNGKKS